MLFDLMERVTIKCTEIIDLQSNLQHLKLNYAAEGQSNMPSTFTNLPIRASSDSHAINNLCWSLSNLLYYTYVQIDKCGGGGASLSNILSVMQTSFLNNAIV